MTSNSAKNMAARFAGTQGRRRLFDALRKQTILRDNQNAIKSIMRKAAINAFENNDIIIKEGDSSTELHFIIQGSVKLFRRRREIGGLAENTHIGEFQAVNPATRRLLTMKACEPTVAVSIAEADFSKVADKNPSVWRQIAVELVDRLSGETAKHSPRRARPRVFIASSTEAQKLVEALRLELLADRVDVQIWSEAFTPGKTHIEVLETQILENDFAILFFSPDDWSVSRGHKLRAPRDNIIFELGLFVGALTRQRALIAQPYDFTIKIPSDLHGLNTIKYKNGDMRFVADKLRQIFAKLGSR